MTPEEIEDLKTFCCGANYVQSRRYQWICEDCKEDRSTEFILTIDSQEKADRLEKWREASKKDAEIIKRKLGIA